MNRQAFRGAIRARRQPAARRACSRVWAYGVLRIGAVLAIGSLAFGDEEAFEIGVWAGPGAGSLPEVTEIYAHHACTGEVARVLVKRLPTSWDKGAPLEPERVEEYDRNGETIHVWPMPVDMRVAGIRGESIYVGRFLLGDANVLRIDLDGTYRPESLQEPYEGELIKCPAQSDTDHSVYLTCWVFRDRASGESRLIRFQFPCT